MTWLMFMGVKVLKDTSFGRLRQIGGREERRGAAEGKKSGNEVRNEKRRAKKGKVTWGKKGRERGAVRQIRTDKCLKRRELQRKKQQRGRARWSAPDRYETTASLHLDGLSRLIYASPTDGLKICEIRNLGDVNASGRADANHWKHVKNQSNPGLKRFWIQACKTTIMRFFGNGHKRHATQKQPCPAAFRVPSGAPTDYKHSPCTSAFKAFNTHPAHGHLKGPLTPTCSSLWARLVLWTDKRGLVSAPEDTEAAMLISLLLSLTVHV